MLKKALEPLQKKESRFSAANNKVKNYNNNRFLHPPIRKWRNKFPLAFFWSRKEISPLMFKTGQPNDYLSMIYSYCFYQNDLNF